MNEKTSAQDLHSWSGNLKSKIKNPKWLGLAIIAFVLVVIAADGPGQQQPKKLYRVRLLVAHSRIGNVEVFRETLREAWIRRRTKHRHRIAICGTGDASRLPSLCR